VPPSAIETLNSLDKQRRGDVWRCLTSSLLCCQGAARHFIDGTTGINDFDVYTFYRANPRKRWYAKRIKAYDFGHPRFGKSLDRPQFVGRRVDCLARAIEGDEDNPIVAVQNYLAQGKTLTARLLAAGAVVLLEPECGTVVWPR
jgi:hypothetical protein